MSSSSEVTFQFSLPDIGAVPFLFYDNSLDFGPNQSVSTAASPTLSQSTTLLTNTDYSFFLETASESDGGSMTPEPPSFLLIAAGLLPIMARRLKRGRRVTPVT